MSAAGDKEQKARVRERFTRSADAFAHLAATQRLGDAERIARLAEASGDDVVVDLACGPGTFTMAMGRRARLVVGLDLTPALLEWARRRAEEEGAGNVALVCGDATALPLGDSSIDVAVCGYSFHHMSEPLTALRELARVLRSGGRAGLMDLIVSSGCDGEARDAIEKARDASHRRTFSAEGFSECVERAGFRVRAIEREERERRFSEWMEAAGWERRDPAWGETRRLMEACIGKEGAGFRARAAEGGGSGGGEIEFTQTCLFLGATKP